MVSHAPSVGWHAVNADCENTKLLFIMNLKPVCQPFKFQPTVQKKWDIYMCGSLCVAHAAHAEALMYTKPVTSHFLTTKQQLPDKPANCQTVKPII